MTRKGLALGTGFALVASLFAATPAQASTVFTEVHKGTTYNVFAGGASNSNFIDLATQLGSATGEGLLKYRVLNPSGATLGFGAANDATAASPGTVTLAQGTAGGGNAAKEDYFSTATGAAINTATTSSTDFVVVPTHFASDESGVAAAYNILRVWATTAGSATITIQAFLDTAAPASHRMDAVETKGPEVTVNFYSESSVTWTTTIQKPAANATSVTAVVTTSPVLNTNYLTGNVTINFTRQGSSVTIESSAASANATSTSWSQSVNLDSSINWAGLPNWYQLASVAVNTGLTAATMGDNELESITYTLDVDADLKSGDVFDIVGSTPSPNNVSNGDVANYTYTPNAKTLVRSSNSGIPNVAAEANSPAWLVVEKRQLTTSIATTTTATYTTSGAHGLRVGDFVTIDSSRNGIFDRTAVRVAVSAVPTTTTFTVALATAQTAATASAADTGLVTYDSFFTAAQGTYTAQAKWNGAVRGAVSDTGSINVAASTMNVSTTASANVQGIDAAGTGHTVNIKSGTLTTDVMLTVYDAAGAAVGAGRPVSIGTLNPVGPVTVNGRSTPGEVLLTDAKGQVKLTIASTTGTAGHQVAVVATAEGIAQAGFTLVWASASVGLVDLNTTGGLLTNNTTYQRKVIEDGSYELRLLAADQWFTPADSATFRVLVSGDGATGGVYPLTAGIATVKISDLDIADTWNTTVKLQRLVSGTWTDSATYTFASDDITSAAAVLGADGSNAYGNTADLSDAVAEVALVERDLRTRYAAAPAYVNDLVLNGRFTNSSTGVALEGTLVTISGPSNVLFRNGNVDKRGSITVLTNASGQFEVNLFSTTAQTDSVITVTGLGVSATTKVTFTGIGAGEGTKLDVTTPAAVKPASTFQVKAKLSDVFGNGVEAPAGRVKVTYTGAGIVFGTLPDKTDKNGELMFSVLLGSNDTGNVVVTVSYDQNGDGDYVDAKDLNTTKTIVISATGSVSTGKVNVGSFNGKLVVYASGLNGARISWKVGGNWGSSVATSNYSIFNRPTPRAGVTVSVEVFVNGVSTLTKSVVTR